MHVCIDPLKHQIEAAYRLSGLARTLHYSAIVYDIRGPVTTLEII